VRIELINTGTELLLGRVLNTHQHWICRRLADHGYVVNRATTVPDAGPEIAAAVQEALGRADLVLTTGGLGPTSDDRTRELVAQLLGRTLHEEPETLAHIKHFFASRDRPMPDRVRVQALVPQGALVLPNPNGTAPGLAIDASPNPFRAGGPPAWLILLPGPTRELRPMMANQVIPLLLQRLPRTEPFVCRTLRTTGLGESHLEERIAGSLDALVRGGLEPGYCARNGEVDIRLVACGADAQRLVAEAEQAILKTLGRHIFGFEDELLEEAVVRLLRESGRTLAVAESCTGGHLANRITNVPGASKVFLTGLVTYSNQAKQDLLGISPETLARHGAVSEPVAREMAEGIRRRTGANIAVATTGIAGPDGGTPEKPVGTVYLGLTDDRGTRGLKRINAYDRETFKQITSQQALELVRRALLRKEREAEKENPAG
jgi:nicotinamide-nucleotide amidase